MLHEQNNDNNLTENKNNFSSEETESNNNSKFNSENNKKPKDNFKVFTLYKNLVKKELPKYSNIETQIDTDKNLLKDYYKINPIFNDILEQSSVVYAFKNGFKKFFFGPEGYITRKSVDLRKFYRALKPKKIDWNKKLYIGSFDVFDSLGGLSAFNKRLKNSQKRIIRLNGNFDLTNPKLFKMKKAYKNFTKKLSLKNDDINNDNNNDNKIINFNINSEKNSAKFKRYSLLTKNPNLFLDYKNNLIQDNTLRITLDKNHRRKNTEINFKNHETLEKLLNLNSISNNTNNTQSNFFAMPNIKSIPKINLFNKTYNKKNIKENLLIKEKEESPKKNVIENYTSKPMKFSEYFKQKNKLKKYVNLFNKSFSKKIYSSNNSNNKIRDSLNNFKVKNEKYVKNKKKYFKKKMQEPYNEFKEDSKNEEIFQNFAKNVDFSNFKAISSKDKKNDKINNFNMAYSFKVSLGGNVPVKDFIKKFKKKKEKEKENKLLKSIRINFGTNSKIIRNLTISLDSIKKKYNY